MNGRWARCGRLLRGAQFAVLALLISCASVQRLSRQATDKLLREPAWRSVEIGLGEDYPREARSLEKARADLAVARATGVTVLRIAFGWDAMEPQRGVYDWSFWDEFVRTATEEYGLRLMPYVCYTPKWAAREPGEDFRRSPPRDPADFGRFVTTLVGRYRAVIHSWELWNEPDNRAYWLGTAAEYAALVRAGSAAVRAADPAARIGLGGIATELPFLETLLRDERLGPAFDVVNLHSYFETWQPDPIEWLPTYIKRAAEIVRASGEAKPLWLAEAGYSSAGPRPNVSAVYAARWQGEHTEAAQAAALARTLLLGLHATGIEVLAWYRINDLPPAGKVIGDDNHRHLGIRRANAELKPAAAALAQLTRIFAEPFRALPVPVKTMARRGADPVVCAFELRSGRYVIAAWMGTPPKTARGTPPTPDTRQARLTVRLPLRAHVVALSDAAAQPLPPSRVALRGREASFELRGGEVQLCIAEP